MLDDRQMMHTIAVTQADYRVMTPDHASPEQIRGDPITTASDIYVLGVVLYELLCGCKPFTLKGNRLGDLERAICEETPPAPSVVIQAREDARIATTARHESGAVAARARRRPRQHRADGDAQGGRAALLLRRAVCRRHRAPSRWDAGARTGRCLELSRRQVPQASRAGCRTGGSVRGVADRLLDHHVRAVRAHRAGARRRAGGARTCADRSATRRRRSRVPDRFVPRRRSFTCTRKEITAREILDQGAARIGKEQAQPDLQATLLDTIGSVYLSLDLPEDAQPLIEQGLAVRRKLFGEKHLDVARSLYSLNRVYEKKGDLKTAEALAIDSLAISTTLTGPDSLETASGMCRLGVILHTKGEFANAQRQLTECLRICIARLGRDHEELTVPLDNLARLAQERRDFVTAGCTARRCGSTCVRAARTIRNTFVICTTWRQRCTRWAISTRPNRCIARQSRPPPGPRRRAFRNDRRDGHLRSPVDGPQPLRRSAAGVRNRPDGEPRHAEPHVEVELPEGESGV